ncbi:LOW QUALITY PROTEIN: transmembrane protein 223 [Macrobrachium rosenbergii]|uniref:LOW QUALITY PROTEIN: transmembrane protein 223 n=1 Tax=Macrobrachium rosenbergii TaxID=79674 RepID=UPI0034D3FB55
MSSIYTVLSCSRVCQFRPMTILERLKQAKPARTTNYRSGQGMTPKRYFHNCELLKQNVGKGKEMRLMVENEFAVEKDTLLYRYDNGRFIKFINIFAISQFVFWSYLSHFAFTMMKDLPISEEEKANPKLPWWRKINFGKYRNGITVGCFGVGWGTMAIAWMYTLRCVRFLVLKKGGANVMFVTFSPFNRYKSLTVPLKEVSARQSRMSSTAYLPLKVKGKYMHFILDMRGEFLNTRLFDYSAGLQRNWTK